MKIIVSKITVRLDDLLEVLIEFKRAVIHMVIVYYSKKRQIKIKKEKKKAYGRVQEKRLQISSYTVIFSQWSCKVTLNSPCHYV